MEQKKSTQKRNQLLSAALDVFSSYGFAVFLNDICRAPAGALQISLAHYLIQKIEVSRTQPKASKLFALEIIQGAPHILEILKGPLKKLFKRKAKVIQIWQEQGKISADIDPELLILNIWAVTQNYADFSIQMEMVTGKTLRNRSMQQRAIEHTVHMMLYGVLPRPSA